MTRLFVGNLAYDLDEQGLAQGCADLGVTVLNPKILRDRETGKPRGFGFIEVADAAQAVQAMNTLNGAYIGGRPIRVEKASRQENRRPAGRAPRERQPDAEATGYDDRPRRTKPKHKGHGADRRRRPRTAQW